ncbi:MAG: hypothetical protein CYPHOPRED_000893 [Cyphobasidiales sp. Tagirdzhanova-0007]|nr:MAG: hypothetical protein CYPHOPRED_000893 [Cyphobasidiales sp. Tagirdzhanova-0007]
MVAGHHHRPKNTTKRYSASEYQHLVPDESGELHDPEYEGIKIVRRPSVSTVASTDTPSEASVSHPPQSGPSYQRYPNASYNTAVPPQNKHLQGLAAPLRTTPKRPSSVLTSQLSEPSVAETRGSVRTYGEGGVTYLAPSITMPAVSSRDSISGSGRAVSSGSYNPFTYIPTTTTAAEAYSGSNGFQHRRQVNFGPTTLHTYTAGTAGAPSEEIAPPIAWSSPFTPSAEHSERHRTRQHNGAQDSFEAGCLGLKKGFQKMKLDISFGLLKLRK